MIKLRNTTTYNKTVVSVSGEKFLISPNGIATIYSDVDTKILPDGIIKIVEASDSAPSSIQRVAKPSVVSKVQKVPSPSVEDAKVVVDSTKT